MVRKLLATSAIISVLSASAFAQSNTQSATPADEAVTAAAPSSGSSEPAPIQYLQTIGSHERLASRMAGTTVFGGTEPDAPKAGEIQNLVVDADGTILAVVLDTGAYLSDDSKTVAVPFGQIEWGMGPDEQRPILTASREQLLAAPAFTNAAPTDAASGSGQASNQPSENQAASDGPSGAATTDMASDTVAPTTSEPATPAPAASVPPTASGEYLATVGPEQYLSETLIGRAIYAGPTTDSDKIGDVNDLVVSTDGRVDAFVIGVGGFLGLGQKDVGVPFDNIALATTTDGEPHASLAATKDELKNAPAFKAPQVDRMAGASGTTSVPTAAVASGTAGGAGTPGASTNAGTGMSADATTAASTTQRDGSAELTPAGPSELTADKLMGSGVVGPNDKRIGTIGDIALTPQGQVDAVIVDVGGFLGIGAKPVAVAMDNLQFMHDASGKLTLMTQFTEEQLRNAPEYNSESYAANRETMRVSNPEQPTPGTSAQ